jgi:hypothetical protein
VLDEVEGKAITEALGSKKVRVFSRIPRLFAHLNLSTGGNPSSAFFIYLRAM